MTGAGRLAEIEKFLAAHDLNPTELVPLADDASFRRYFRVRNGSKSLVLMDAPPGREDVRPFIIIAGHLRSFGYSAPEILAADTVKGFVLLEDFGDEKLSTLARQGGIENAHYELAVDVLADLHARPAAISVPVYDETLLMSEVRLFIEWYLPSIVPSAPSLEAGEAFERLWRQALVPYAGARETLVLLDYHADNLMWLPQRLGLAKLGLLDFQDAVIGHPAYDLVSLLEDARLDVDVDLAESMLDRYVDRRACDQQTFRAAYAILGAQRNTKIIGIFTRLFARDGKSGYLELIPRVWRYLERDLGHPALADLRRWYDHHAPPSGRAAVPSPAQVARAHPNIGEHTHG
ncbi:MAG: phosphotransferase [Proteobacteria bacterium]|nr:phosphotransferase [Pseudomonadota bacterium]